MILLMLISFSSKRIILQKGLYLFVYLYINALLCSDYVMNGQVVAGAKVPNLIYRIRYYL